MGGGGGEGVGIIVSSTVQCVSNNRFGIEGFPLRDVLFMELC